MKKIINLFFILALSGISLIVNAQSLRPPTPQEKAVLQKVVNALNKITGSFDDINWQTTDNNFDPSLVVPIGAHARIGIGYTIKLSFKEGSPLYHKVMDPLLALMNNANAGNIDSISEMTEKLSTVTIDIEINSGAIGLGTSPNQNKQLKVDGASKAFVVAQDNYTPRRNGAYVLAFGNWKNAKYNHENFVYDFQYQHLPQTPYMENVTIEIYGNDNKIQQMIQHADWNTLNAALTK